MKIWKKARLSNSKDPRYSIDIKELKLRLESIAKEGNIEVVQLAIESLLEEINEQK